MTYPDTGYNPQYSFWPYYQGTPQELLAPARFAGWLLIALGILLMLGGSCVGAALYAAPDELFDEAIREMTRQQPGFNFTPKLLRVTYGIFGGIVGVFGVVCIVTGILVRKGTIVPIVLGLIVTIVPLLLACVLFLLSFTAGVQGVISFICMFSLPTLLLATATILLIRAARNVSKIALTQQQMAAMYQQQMQQYYMQQSPPVEGTRE